MRTSSGPARERRDDERDLVAAVAAAIEPHLAGIADALTVTMTDEIVELDDEPDLRSLLHASISSNLAAAVYVLRHDIPVEHVATPPAARAYSERLAQRGVPLHAMLRAYRIGVAAFQDRWLAALRDLIREGRLDLDGEDVAVTTRIVLRTINHFIDRVCELAVALYTGEQHRWNRHGAAARAERLRALFAENEPDLAAAERSLGYRLLGRHVGVVAWAGSSLDDPVPQLLAFADTLAERWPGRVLVALADDRTVWAWVSLSPGERVTTRDLAAILCEHEGINVALGTVNNDLEGLRCTHREALHAQHVAQLRARAGTAPTCLGFAELDAASFLATDVPMARAWVLRALGDLARDDQPTARLRETLATYLRSGANYTDAATALVVHKNTVRYRVARAESLRGRPATEDRLDLEVALQVCAELGEAVLAPCERGVSHSCADPPV